jgi:hypothetical protein
MARLVELACADASVPAGPASDGVEVLVRSDNRARWRFFLNHSTVETTVELSEVGHEVLTATDVSGAVGIGPRGVAIVRSPIG